MQRLPSAFSMLTCRDAILYVGICFLRTQADGLHLNVTRQLTRSSADLPQILRDATIIVQNLKGWLADGLHLHVSHELPRSPKDLSQLFRDATVIVQK
jgi:hypothetical protein